MLVFMVPALILVVGLLVYPLFLSIFTSFHSSRDDSFVGFANYQRFLKDPLAGGLVLHTYMRGILGVIPSYIIGLLVALLINSLKRWRIAVTIVALLPFVISAPVALNMWKILLDSRTGLPATFGLDIGGILTNSDLVWPVLTYLNTWGSFQLYVLILLAAIRRIPTELTEASAIDGAGRWQRFRAVTFPGISGASIGVLMVHFIASFQEFNLIYILTGGGPLGQTQSLATAAYQSAFTNYDQSYATTLTTTSLVLMLATLGLAALAIVMWRKARAQSQENWAARVLSRPVSTGMTPRSPRPVARKVRTKPVRSRRQQLVSTRVARGIGAAVVIIYAFFPIAFLVSTSFDGTPPGSQTISLWPRDPTFGNYVKVLTNSDLWSNDNISLPPLALNFANSLIVTAATTIGVCIIGIFAGYALSRLRIRITGLLALFFVLLQLVPVIVLVFPLYEVLATVQLLGTPAGLILATSALYLPIGVIFFKIFFDGLPVDAEEAASIDGAGRFRTFISVVLPVSKPVIGAVAALTLINTWNEFLFATSLISESRSRTLPPALNQYMSSLDFIGSTSPGQQAVYLLIPVIAAAIILLSTQRLLMAAYEGGGVKG